MWEVASPLGPPCVVSQSPACCLLAFPDLLLAETQTPTPFSASQCPPSRLLFFFQSAGGGTVVPPWRLQASASRGLSSCPLQPGPPQATIQPVLEGSLKHFQAHAGFDLLDFEVNIYHYN